MLSGNVFLSYFEQTVSWYLALCAWGQGENCQGVEGFNPVVFLSTPLLSLHFTPQLHMNHSLTPSPSFFCNSHTVWGHLPVYTDSLPRYSVSLSPYIIRS